MTPCWQPSSGSREPSPSRAAAITNWFSRTLRCANNSSCAYQKANRPANPYIPSWQIMTPVGRR
jgi:hypothetical protein